MVKNKATARKIEEEMQNEHQEEIPQIPCDIPEIPRIPPIGGMEIFDFTTQEIPPITSSNSQIPSDISSIPFIPTYISDFLMENDFQNNPQLPSSPLRDLPCAPSNTFSVAPRVVHIEPFQHTADIEESNPIIVHFANVAEESVIMEDNGWNLNVSSELDDQIFSFQDSFPEPASPNMFQQDNAHILPQSPDFNLFQFIQNSPRIHQIGDQSLPPITETDENTKEEDQFVKWCVRNFISRSAADSLLEILKNNFNTDNLKKKISKV